MSSITTIVFVVFWAAFALASTDKKGDVKTVDLVEEWARSRQDLAKSQEETKPIIRKENTKLRQEDQKLKEQDEKLEEENKSLQQEPSKLSHELHQAISDMKTMTTKSQKDQNITQELKKMKDQIKDDECDENWKAKNHKPSKVKNCETYSNEGWCHKDGGYGPNWNFEDWNNFGKYADAAGRTALVCPQCGCRDSSSKIRDDNRIRNIAQSEINEFLLENKLCVTGTYHYNRHWTRSKRLQEPKGALRRIDFDVDFKHTFPRVPTFTASLSTVVLIIAVDPENRYEQYLGVIDSEVTRSSAKGITIVGSRWIMFDLAWIACL